MANEEAGLSGDLARLLLASRCDLRKLVREHTPDDKGRCPTCKSIGCTLYRAAVLAAKMKARREARVDAELRAKGLLDG